LEYKGGGEERGKPRVVKGRYKLGKKGGGQRRIFLPRIL